METSWVGGRTFLKYLEQRRHGFLASSQPGLYDLNVCDKAAPERINSPSQAIPPHLSSTNDIHLSDIAHIELNHIILPLSPSSRKTILHHNATVPCSPHRQRHHHIFNLTPANDVFSNDLFPLSRAASRNTNADLEIRSYSWYRLQV